MQIDGNGFPADPLIESEEKTVALSPFSVRSARARSHARSDPRTKFRAALDGEMVHHTSDRQYRFIGT